MAALALAGPLAPHTPTVLEPIATVGDEALPGGGRPPSPGPTDPDGLAG